MCRLDGVVEISEDTNKKYLDGGWSQLRVIQLAGDTHHLRSRCEFSLKQQLIKAFYGHFREVTWSHNAKDSKTSPYTHMVQGHWARLSDSYMTTFRNRNSTGQSEEAPLALQYKKGTESLQKLKIWRHGYTEFKIASYRDKATQVCWKSIAYRHKWWNEKWPLQWWSTPSLLVKTNRQAS